MSDNYRLYAQKVAEARSQRRSDGGPLREQLHELLETVRWCERIWTIEDRIDRELGS
jgi:hypothetical protein